MTEWYYRDSQSRKIGPLSTPEFDERVDAGEVQPNTRVWRSGLIDWTTYAALLAHDASCASEASGPTTSSAPQSSSYQTMIALGASPTNCRPTGHGTVTPSSTPPLAPEPVFEYCLGCREQLPSNVFRQIGSRRICGDCCGKFQAKAERDRLRNARSVDASWLGNFLVRVAIGAAALIAVRLVVIEMRTRASHDLMAQPVSGEFAAGPVPRSLVPGASIAPLK